MFVVTSVTQPGPLQLIPAVNNPFGFGPGSSRGSTDRADPRGVHPGRLCGLGVLHGLQVPIRRPRGTPADEMVRPGAGSVGDRTRHRDIRDGLHGWTGRGNVLTVYVFTGAVVPVAIGIAILRYHLYDIDRIISRTISYAGTSALMVALFQGVVVAMLDIVVSSFAEGESIAVAASTLRVAAVFGPLRRRVQTMVDRRFDRSTYDAELTVQAMTARLQHDVDLGRVEADVLGVVNRTFHPATAAIWLRESAEMTTGRGRPRSVVNRSHRTVMVAVAWLTAVAGAVLVVVVRSASIFAGVPVRSRARRDGGGDRDRRERRCGPDAATPWERHRSRPDGRGDPRGGHSLRLGLGSRWRNGGAARLDGWHCIAHRRARLCSRPIGRGTAACTRLPRRSTSWPALEVAGWSDRRSGRDRLDDRDAASRIDPGFRSRQPVRRQRTGRIRGGPYDRYGAHFCEPCRSRCSLRSWR